MITRGYRAIAWTLFAVVTVIMPLASVKAISPVGRLVLVMMWSRELVEKPSLNIDDGKC